MTELKFPSPNCATCSAMTKTGPAGYETRYCTGFRGNKKKRLPKAGLKRSVAPWCPKVMTPPVCNILGFQNANHEMMEYMMHFDILTSGKDKAFPTERRYKLRCTVALGMNARMFWDEVHIKPLSTLLPDTALAFGEIVEIDDGFKAYYFYYAGEGCFLPAPLFDGSKVARDA